MTLNSLFDVTFLLDAIADDVMLKIKDPHPRTTFLNSLDTSATGVYQDTYTLMMQVGFFGGVLMFICALIVFMISGGPQERSQAKKKISWILIGVGLLSMAVALVGWIYSAFNSL